MAAPTPAPTSLAGAYGNGTGTLTLNSTGGGILIKDNATPLAGSLLSVQNNGGTVKYLDITDNGTQTFTSAVADGAAATGFKINTTVALANASSRTLTFQTAGADRLYVTPFGSVIGVNGPNGHDFISFTGAWDTTYNTGAGIELRPDINEVDLFPLGLAGGTLYYRFGTTYFLPSIDVTANLGSLSARWATAYIGTSVITPSIGATGATQHALPAGTDALLGATSLGNFTFTANALDLSGAGTITIGASVANGLTIGKSSYNVLYPGGMKVHRFPRADSPLSVTAGDYLDVFSSITATRIATLPDAAISGAGTLYWVGDESGSVSATVKINVQSAGGTIDGVAAGTGVNIIVPRGMCLYESDGTNWHTMVGAYNYDTGIVTPTIGTTAAAQHALPAGTGGLAALDQAQTFTKSQNVASVAITDAATITTDASLGNAFTVTLAGNRTLANPTNLVAGGTYLWVITQDGTGTRTLAYGTNFKWPGGTAPVLTVTAGAVDMISAFYNGTSLLCVFQADFR